MPKPLMMGDFLGGPLAPQLLPQSGFFSQSRSRSQGELRSVIAPELQKLDAVVETLQEENSRLRHQLLGSALGSFQSAQEENSKLREKLFGSAVGFIHGPTWIEFTDKDSRQISNRPLFRKCMPVRKPTVKCDVPDWESGGIRVQFNIGDVPANRSSLEFAGLEEDGRESTGDSERERMHESQRSATRSMTMSSNSSEQGAETRSTTFFDAEKSGGTSMAPMRVGRKMASAKETFQLLPIFHNESQFAPKHSMSKMGVSQTDRSFQRAVSMLNEASASNQKCEDCDKRLQGYMMSPLSPWSIGIDVVAVIMILYDCIAVPILLLQDAASSNHTFILFMFWVSRIFWTLAIPRTFITGYMKKDGTIETNSLRIARKYCKTWLIFDIIIVITDWLASNTGGAVRIIRLLKAARLARMFRIPNTLIRQFNYAHAEKRLLWFTILESMFTFVLVNHFLACIWYWIGLQNGNDGWVPNVGVQELSTWTKYTYSMHWSTSQFIGSTQVMPYSSTERAFGAFVMLFAFIWSASFISNITAAMTRLQLLSGEKAKQISALQHFLANNKISGQLALRVLQSAKFLLKESKNHQAAENVELLSMLSQPMRNEIHYEMHSGHLMQHPFFWHYNVHEKLALQKLCHSAISMFRLGSGDVVFAQGEQPAEPHMFFIISGTLFYIKDFDGDGNVDPEEMAKVTSSMWVCEPVLWIKWTHVGNLRAATYCSVLALSAETFRTVISEYVTTPYPAEYAAQLVSMMNLAAEASLEPDHAVDDLLSGIDVHGLARQVFPHYLVSTKKLFGALSRSGGARSFSRSFSNSNVR